MPTFKLMRRPSESPDAVTKRISEHISEMDRAARQRKAEVRFGSQYDNETRLQDRALLFPNASYRSPTRDLNPFITNFWNMKQRGELSADETLAVYAVMMRAIDASEVVRIVLTWGVNNSGVSQGSFASPERALVNYVSEMSRHSNGVLKPQFIAKVRGNLVARMKQVAARKGHQLTMLDWPDAELLLRACQMAVELKQEDEKRWARL